MATKKSDKPTKAPAQSDEAIPMHKRLAFGQKPNTGGSYAKGPKTPA